jgi:hypothetical protein
VSSGVLFDLMPTDPAILGFSNRWYPEAVKTATHVQLSDRILIRVISAPAFVATKLEAFVSRGGSDILSSHDLEDILNVIDGRPSIVDEMTAEQMRCRSTLASSSRVCFRDRTLRTTYRVCSRMKTVWESCSRG